MHISVLARLRALLAATALASAAPGGAALAAASGGTIRWDQYGVPHIYGPDIPSVVRGLGYAQMEAHAELLLNSMARARGRGAEFLGAGPSNFNITYDQRVHGYNIPALAKAWWAQAGDFQTRVIQAFCDGANEYAANHPNDIPAVLKPILPIVPTDLTATELNTIWYTFLVETSRVNSFVSAWQAGGARAAAQVKALGSGNGSNGWALGPAKVASGGTILMGNPHLPWGINQIVGNDQGKQNFGVYQWIEANLIIGNPAAPTLNASGVTFIGGTFIGIGFSDKIAWTHTNNTIKNADVYELTLDATGTKYKFGTSFLPLTHKVDVIRVRNADGTVSAQRFDVWGSLHGPVVAFNAGRTKALAVRVPLQKGTQLVTQYWQMIQARNAQEFIAAESMEQMPFFNTMFADTSKNIWYLFGGGQPLRSGGTFDDYARILDGSNPTQLWTRVVPFAQLPQALNPPTGWIANSNNPPWNTVWPAPASLNPANYPAWLAPQMMHFRAQHGASFLASTGQLTWDQVLAGKTSSYMTISDRILPDLLTWANEIGDAKAKAAAQILAAWDRTGDAASVGGGLFENWYGHVEDDIGAGKISRDTSLILFFTYPKFRTPWDPGNPFTTPNGLDPANKAALVADLSVAYDDMNAKFAAVGGASAKWGDVHKITIDNRNGPYLNPTFPITAVQAQSGTDDLFGPLRNIWSIGESSALAIGQTVFGYYPSIGGDGYVQVIEFPGSGTMRAGTLLTYGNASRPGSPHVTDQLDLFGAKQLKPALRTVNDVLRATVAEENY